MTKHLRIHSLFYCFVCLFLCACSTVPITGRRQLLIYPESELMAMSFTQYGDFLSENELSKNPSQIEMVQRVGKRIQVAVEEYFARQGLSGELAGYDWKFNLIEKDQANAWCMPGGRVVVYTGLLPITKNEAGLAAIMGHEIAHAIAKHGNERMSQSDLFSAGGSLLSHMLDEEDEEEKALWMLAYGVGGQYLAMLPYSRLHESEADRLGLIFMSMAGYDPHAALGVWERMSKMGGDKPLEILSTHPSDERRLEDIKKNLPEALGYYRPM